MACFACSLKSKGLAVHRKSLTKSSIGTALNTYLTVFLNLEHSPYTIMIKSHAYKQSVKVNRA